MLLIQFHPRRWTNWLEGLSWWTRSFCSSWWSKELYYKFALICQQKGLALWGSKSILDCYWFILVPCAILQWWVDHYVYLHDFNELLSNFCLSLIYYKKTVMLFWIRWLSVFYFLFFFSFFLLFPTKISSFQLHNFSGLEGKKKKKL